METKSQTHDHKFAPHNRGKQELPELKVEEA